MEEAEDKDNGGEGIDLSPEQSLGWVWVVGIILVVAISIAGYFYFRKRQNR